MANPRIRPNIRFFGEVSAALLKESWQFRRWVHELSPDLATPMVRLRDEDYYVHEPAVLMDGRNVIPFRWYTRYSHHTRQQEFHGEGWVLHPVSCDSTSERGFIVHEYEHVTFSASSLVASFPKMQSTFRSENKPDPTRIIGECSVQFFSPVRATSSDGVCDTGIIRQRGAGVHPSTHTDPRIGNR